MSPADWRELTKRPTSDFSLLRPAVQQIMEDVHHRGDVALKELTRRFDKATIEKLEVSEQEIARAESVIPAALAEAIRVAHGNIERFHRASLYTDVRVETMPGVLCWKRRVPISPVGLYIPGGTAPLFSTVLMLGVPANIAGVQEVVLCTPPRPDGSIEPAILFAAAHCGIKRIFRVGGAQAIAAMTFGTESIPAVRKIFGPGNQYVTCAKQLAQEYGVAIDMPAGPSELAIIADDSANASFVAADLLSQAEHGIDSQVVLLTTSASFAERVVTEMEIQCSRLPRHAIATVALAQSRILIAPSLDAAVQFVNEYAPEHLIINTANPEALGAQVTCAGSVFLGAYSPESVGDYASGTNHVLPTGGFAAASGGVSTESFLKSITYQTLSPDGLRALGQTVATMAEQEGLEGHRRAVTIRLEQLDER
ncbi:MAG: histidinol dehydrogenase [Bdellovibrionales bacterium]|nr:histidinol dehydrogenase [Bdellovibrionales bacterium]